MSRKPWLPPLDSSKPLDVADLSDMVPGPDPAYQTHGPGCQCGDMGCPWYRGERAAKIYRNLSAEDRRRMDNDFVEAMREPYEWQMIEAARAAMRPRRGWLGWFRGRGGV